VVGSQILIFFFTAPSPDLTPVIEHFYSFFSESHPKQSQRDVSLQMYYCASSVSLNAHVLAGLGEFPVESNEMAMKRMGN